MTEKAPTPINNSETESNTERILSEIDKLSAEKQNEKALELIWNLEDGEEKYYRAAYIGANYVEAGELEKAQEIADRLEKNEESLPYAGGVLELILNA